MQTKVYWIDGPWPGRLAILPRPRGGDWLEDEVRAWQMSGIDVVVSLLTHDEIAELDLVKEAEYCTAHGLAFLSFPILDRDVPSSSKAFLSLVQTVERFLSAGKGVAIHCRIGVGRSALLAASLLAATGVPADTAFARIRSARGCAVPDTQQQREWVANLMGLDVRRRIDEGLGQLDTAQGMAHEVTPERCTKG